ncbi:hypothetical protein [Saccharothrix lopnurensis]|uniref:Uncharacterized protein n=1 Tax=Saccharothrix lopnurensis TaxID=1670621 RepID=A0ABW1PBT2_9PSEU
MPGFGSASTISPAARDGVGYVAAPARGGAPIAGIAFDLPAGGRVEAAWPAPTAGPLRFTAIVEPVS